MVMMRSDDGKGLWNRRNGRAFMPATVSLSMNRQLRLLPELPRRPKQKTMLSKMRTSPAGGFGDEDAGPAASFYCKVTCHNDLTDDETLVREHGVVGVHQSLCSLKLAWLRAAIRR